MLPLLQGEVTLSSRFLQVAFCLTEPHPAQLNLDPRHLPDAEALKHIQLDLGYAASLPS